MPFRNPVLAAWGRDLRFWWQNAAQECGRHELFTDFDTTTDALGTTNTHVTDLDFALTPIVGVPTNSDHGPFIPYKFTVSIEPNLPAAANTNTFQMSIGIKSGAFAEVQTNRAQNKWAEASHRTAYNYSWYLYLDRRNTIDIHFYCRNTSVAGGQIWTLNNEGTHSFLEPLLARYQNPDVFDYSDA